MFALLVWTMAFAKLMDDTCAALAPRGAGDVAQLPEWVAPTTFRCVTWGGDPVVEFRAGEPLGFAVFVLVPTVLLAGWVCYVLLARPPRRRSRA